MARRSQGGWLSGRALPSHGRGHWFEPSTAHMTSVANSPSDTGSARRVLAAGLGALAGGFLVYVSLAGMGGGVDWEDRLTMDQSGELELEGVGLLLGMVAAVVVGIPVGTYLGLRWTGAQKRVITAVAVGAIGALVTIAVLWSVPSAPDDPVLLPYAVFGSWFLIGAATRAVIERNITNASERPF